jgi:hypothetical protein
MASETASPRPCREASLLTTLEEACVARTVLPCRVVRGLGVFGLFPLRCEPGGLGVEQVFVHTVESKRRENPTIPTTSISSMSVNPGPPPTAFVFIPVDPDLRHNSTQSSIFRPTRSGLATLADFPLLHVPRDRVCSTNAHALHCGERGVSKLQILSLLVALCRSPRRDRAEVRGRRTRRLS